MATGMQGLLLWCKQITKPYGDDTAVKNMTTSWKNGMAFCAIIHHYRPDLIDFNKLSKENIAENNALAFSTAEDELGIPALLDVEDMVEMRVPDRLSIMTYVSQYYNYFKDKVPGEIEMRKAVHKKRSTKSPSESVPAKRSMDDQVSPVLQKTTPSVNKNACWSCSKTVYLMERLSVEGYLFHRICFKCTVCGKQLKNSTYEYDKISSKFYCAKDFKDRKENEPVKAKASKIGEDDSHIEKMDHSVAETKSNSLKDNEKSPFKRNEHFYRQGIHPESPVKEPNDGTNTIIKSKEDESKGKGKVKHGKSLFSGVMGKKHKGGHEYSNPSYDKHLDLSKFMNRLGGSKETSPEPPVDGMPPDKSETNDSENANKGPQLSGHTAVKSETSENIENSEDKGAKVRKKKLVLKLKKKKDKKVITEEGNDNKKSDLCSINKQTDTKQTSVVKESEYENIGIYRRRTSGGDNVEKIYDNVNLCKVIQTDKMDPNLKIYDNCNLKSGKTNVYKDDINIYATPNIGAKSTNNSIPLSRSTVVYETMESAKTETVENNLNRDSVTSKVQYMSIGNGLDNIESDRNVENPVDNDTTPEKEENKIDTNNINNSSLNTPDEDLDNINTENTVDIGSVDKDSASVDNSNLDTSIQINDSDVNIDDNSNTFSDNFIDVNEGYVQNNDINNVLSEGSIPENSLDTIGNANKIIHPDVDANINDDDDGNFNISNEELIINNNEVDRLDNSLGEIKDDGNDKIEDKTAVVCLDDNLNDHFIDCSIADNFDLRSKETLPISENDDELESTEETNGVNMDINVDININVNVDNEVNDEECATEMEIDDDGDCALKADALPGHGSQNFVTNLNTNIEEKETLTEECMDVTNEITIENTSNESQLDIHPTEESKFPEDVAKDENYEKIERSDSHGENDTGKQTDGTQELGDNDIPEIHVESEDNVVDTEINIATSAMPDENVSPVHAEVKQSVLLDSDLSDNPRESVFAVSSDNPFSDSDNDVENEKVPDDCVKEVNLSDIGTPVGTDIHTEVSTEDNLELDKTSLEGDDGLPKDENRNDDVDVDTHVKVHKSKSEELNPFLSSSDSSPEMKPKKDQSNPFLSSSDEISDDDEDFEDYDDTNPFAEDVRLERSNTYEKHKGKPNVTDKFQIGILEETNPFADEILDPSNPFSDEFDEEYLVNNVPEITSSIPKSDKKLVLKTKSGLTVRRNSDQDSLNSTPTAKQRRKKRAAPKAPSISAASTPSPVLHRQSIKKRAAPKPPGATNHAAKLNLMERRNEAEGRNSIRKRQAPKPPQIAIQRNEEKGDTDTICDSKSDSNLSNTSNTTDIKEVAIDEDLDERCIVGNDAECHEEVDGKADSPSRHLVEELNLDVGVKHFVGNEDEIADNINQEQMDSSISDIQYEEQLQLNSMEVENVSNDSSSLPSTYENADQTINDENMQSYTCEKLNSTEDFSNLHDSKVNMTSSSSNDSLSEPQIIHDDTPVSNIPIHSDSEKQTFNSTDFHNLESNVSSASSNSLVSRSDSVSKHIDSNPQTETTYLNDDAISLSKSSNQDGSLSSMCTEYNDDVCSMTECELYENKALNHLEIRTTNSLPNQKVVNDISHSESTSSLPNIYGSSEKRKAPPKPPRQYTEGIEADGIAVKQPKREEMEKELQYLEVKQRELEMEGVVMEQRLRECSDGEPEEAYLLTWFELVNQKNMLLRRENELIYLCQEMDFLQNQRSAEFELRQLMMKPDDEKTEYDTHREEQLLAEILDFVTKRSNIVDQMDEDRIREYEEDQEIFSMMAAQGLKTSTTNLSEETTKSNTKEKKSKNKDKITSKEKKELKIKKSKEKVETNGTNKSLVKEKSGTKDITKEKIDSKTKKKLKQEKKESKVK